MNLEKYKPTFFSVLSIFGIIVGIPFGIYATTLRGGASLAAVVIFAVVIGLIILLVLDRVLVSIFNPKNLSIVEFVISIILLTIFFIRID